MSESTPQSGEHPYGGQQHPPEDEGIPGEVPEEGTHGAPESAGRTDDETASRAATEGEMSSLDQGANQPSPEQGSQTHGLS